MKSFFLLTSIFVILFTGCSPVKVIDNVPSGSPKGYVEFYYLPGEGDSEFNYSIYSTFIERINFLTLKGEKFYEGHLPGGNLTLEKTSLFIAKRPGEYNFSVRVSTLDTTFPLTIEESKVTRVKILFKNIKRLPEKNVKLSDMPDYFKIEVSQDKPVSFNGDFN